VPLPVLGRSLLFRVAFVPAAGSAGDGSSAAGAASSSWVLPAPLAQLTVGDSSNSSGSEGSGQLMVLGPGQQLPGPSSAPATAGMQPEAGGVGAALLTRVREAAKAAGAGSGQEAAVEAAERAIRAGGQLADGVGAGYRGGF